MATFNSKEYDWTTVTVVLLGKPVEGIRGIEYKSKRAKELLFASGKKARGIQMGKKEYEGTITVLQSELIAMQTAAKAKGYDDVTDLEFDIIVSYISETGINRQGCQCLHYGSTEQHQRGRPLFGTRAAFYRLRRGI